MTTAPLLERVAGAEFASSRHRALSATDFCTHINRLATRLPDRGFAINLCRDRVGFLGAFCAVIARGQCNLLPANRQPVTLARLLHDYPDCYVLHDGDALNIDGLCIDIAASPDANVFSETSLRNRDFDARLPQIPLAQLAAISFTSGTTGKSQPNEKTWKMLRAGTAVNCRHMLKASSATANLLATVPPQHMYGLETSVLLPMFANVCVHAGQPLYPADVAAALRAMAPPRILVTTPAHLRALVESHLAYPAVETIMSATAPLERGLAQRVEKVFDAELVEIYGCTEAGSLARRRTANERNWQPFDAMRFESEVSAEGLETWTVQAAHLPTPVALQDNLEFSDDGTFALSGRRGDLINVAGKRGSLAELTEHLLSVDGVVDAVVFDPSEDLGRSAVTRLAAFVVAPSLALQEIQRALAPRIDPVFMPRPLLKVSSLPRSESSKLPRAAVLELFAQVRRTERDESS